MISKEIREMIERDMNKVCGHDWFEYGMTEKQCATVCERCPYFGRCEEMGIMWGCPNWEESMGEDV